MDRKTAERLAELLDVLAGAEYVEWLFRPHPLLGDAIPAQRILGGKPEDVIELVDQVMSGAYV